MQKKCGGRQLLQSVLFMQIRCEKNQCLEILKNANGEKTMG